MGKTMEASGSGYRWSFVRIGGVDQVVLRNGDDITHIPRLDQKLWAALAMPKKGAGILPETLDAIDSEKDGRIRAADVINAIDFATLNLSSLDEFFTPGEALRLTDIKTSPIKEAAVKTLDMSGSAKAQEVSLSDSAIALEKFSAQRDNGDGVVPPDAAGSDALASLIADIVAAGYGVQDLNGKAGVNKEGLEAFQADAARWLEWHDKGKNSAINPLGEQTEAAWTGLTALGAKMDDWFLRSQLAAFPGAKNGLLDQDERLALLLASNIDATSPELLELPLAAAAADKILDMDGALNPGWAPALRAFALAAAPLLGKDPSKIHQAGWENAKAALKDYGAWRESQPALKASLLGADRLAEMLQLKELAALPALIEEDAAQAALRDSMLDLRKLVLLRRDLVRILKNFVNFIDFYTKKDGIFQAGRLFLDSRECELCIEVDNPDSHPGLVPLSNAYLAYCTCSRKDGATKNIVAAFTAGAADYLIVGRNGVFYDRDGLDWDARITKIIVQPVSIREAFFAPYKWLSRTLDDMAQKRAAAAEADRQNKMLAQTNTTVAAAAAPEKKPEPKKIDVGTVAAIGVAMGSVGALITGLLTIFLGLGVWIPVGILVILLLVSGPSMLLAYIKLRKRTLGPILDAEGWAINGRLKINVPFGKTLTHQAVLPPGSDRQMQDPYAEKKKPWGLYITIFVIAIVLLLWLTGLSDAILPSSMQFRTLIGR